MNGKSAKCSTTNIESKDQDKGGAKSEEDLDDTTIC